MYNYEDYDDEIELQPELKDLLDSLHRFNAVNNQKTAFVGAFISFDDNGDPKCESCLKVAYGYQDELGILMEQLDDIIENKADEEGFVNE